MKHIHDVIREHLLKGKVYNDFIPRSVEEVELIKEVYTLSFNRLKMGNFRYGTLADKALRGYTKAITARHNAYETSHNTELLLDIINLAVIEFLYPTYNDAHFEPIDDGIHCEK